MIHFTVLLTIVFLVKSGKRCLSMTTLYEAFSIVRIALLKKREANDGADGIGYHSLVGGRFSGSVIDNR